MRLNGERNAKSVRKPDRKRWIYPRPAAGRGVGGSTRGPAEQKIRPIRQNGGVHLAGFGMTGFRSFHGPLQIVGPLERINLIAGQNNCGKSHVLVFASRLRESFNSAPRDLDIPRITGSSAFEVAVAVNTDELIAEQPANLRDQMGRITGALRGAPSASLSNDELLWFVRRASDNGQLSNRRQTEAVLSETSDVDWHSLLANLGRGRSSSDPRLELGRWMDEIAATVETPNVRVVGASRRITDLLVEMSSPARARRHRRI